MIPVRPSKVIGIGRNYVAHAQELGNPMPAVPIIFFKPPTSLIGDGDTIVLPGVSHRGVRGEIGIVIGRRLRDADWRKPSGELPATPASTTSPAAISSRPTASGGGPKGSTPSARWAPGCGGARLAYPGADLPGQRRRTAAARSSDMHFSIPHLVSFVSGS
jgi:2-keto-4-pentenoate hydratase/2-oxohepta-3-ene-1,7-dioic acid hydratase in catechol pathway